MNNTKGVFIVRFYRLSHYIYSKKHLKFILFPIRILYKILINYIMGIEIPDSLKIGSDFSIFHGQGIVIHSDCKLGDGLILRHNVTIGNSKRNGKCPVLGNNINIGCGAVIIGDIEIKDNVIIGANTVVNKSIPKNSVVVGNPMKILLK
tara:strand:+ start:180 stop:626 length:447 start_codon:yes stop_codon:yes gene_type:complete